MAPRRLPVWIAFLVVALGGTLAGQSLSEQVLQLLVRDNTWVGQQTFQNHRLTCAPIPADTANRLYCDGSGVIYWNGAQLAGGGGGGPGAHTLLSTTHPDATAATVSRGSIIAGGPTPSWVELVVGTAGQVLRSDGTDIAWSSDGTGLTSLNASSLSLGTVPLARLANISDTEIAGAAAIAWTKISKTGSSLADLVTRSAADLTSGTLPDARLSANVSLLGAAIDLSGAEVTGNLPVTRLNSGTSAGPTTFWRGDGTWSTVPSGAGGTVTSVALSMPAQFAIAGSPITGAGTLAVTLATQTANIVWAGPTTGSPAAPTFRALVNADFPTSGVVAGSYPKVTVNSQGLVTAGITTISATTEVTGVLPAANGGTGVSTLAANGVLYGNGAGAIQVTAAGGTTTVLTANGGAPSFSNSPTLVDLTLSDDLTVGDQALITGLVSITGGLLDVGSGVAATQIRLNGTTVFDSTILFEESGTDKATITWVSSSERLDILHPAALGPSMRFVATGVNILNQPGFFAYNSVADSNVTTGSTIEFDTEQANSDPGGDYDPATDTFTAPQDGFYLFCTHAEVTDASTYTVALSVTIAGTLAAPYQVGKTTAGGATTNSVGGCSIIQMASGDTATVVMTSSVTVDTIAGGVAPVATFFTGRLLM